MAPTVRDPRSDITHPQGSPASGGSRGFGGDELQPLPVGVDVRAEPPCGLTCGVISLGLTIVREEVEHALVAGDLQHVRQAGAVVVAARFGARGENLLWRAPRATGTEVANFRRKARTGLTRHLCPPPDSESDRARSSVPRFAVARADLPGLAWPGEIGAFALLGESMSLGRFEAAPVCVSVEFSGGVGDGRAPATGISGAVDRRHRWRHRLHVIR